ncbi:unnamed protein product, partial [Polarella glacialis]
PLREQTFLPVAARKRKLCIHHEGGMCRRGAECNFAHGPEDLVDDFGPGDSAKRPMTERMDFSGLEVGRLSKVVTMPPEQVGPLMTDVVRELLLEVSGAYDIEWDKVKRLVTISGTAVQMEKAEKALQRVSAHCNWGANEAKIRSILRPRTDLKSARVRLASMVPNLKDFTKTLTVDKPAFTMGTDPSNALRIQATGVSRSHAVIEFAPEKGAVYVIDASTNGTFLNGRRLPPKSSGKVLLSHGDELMLQDPSSGSEFGYMVNLEMS